MAGSFIRFVGPNDNLQIGGVKLLGFDVNNAHKLLFTAVLVAVIYLVGKILSAIADHFAAKRQKVAFWTGQGISLVLFFVVVIGLVSIWFDNPTRLATGVGLVGAGLAFAMQKVVTSFAAYFVILRGETFNIGDRIRMGGVRGDVIRLNFIQTVIMEMGEPPAVQQDDPGMWVHSRQYSGRIVTVSNSEIFEQPVYNYTRNFPYIWEEMLFPIAFKDDHHKAEEIILDAVSRSTSEMANLAQEELNRLKRDFFIEAADIKPRIYLRITDNWVELSVRFLCRTHDIRGLKDRISRDILAGLDSAGIGIASGTYEIVGVPPIKIEQLPPPSPQLRQV